MVLFSLSIHLLHCNIVSHSLSLLSIISITVNVTCLTELLSFHMATEVLLSLVCVVLPQATSSVFLLASFKRFTIRLACFNCLAVCLSVCVSVLLVISFRICQYFNVSPVKRVQFSIEHTILSLPFFSWLFFFLQVQVVTFRFYEK